MKMRVYIRTAAVAALALLVLLCGCSQRYYKAEITMQDGGVIRLELDAKMAPKTVENFVKLANEGFYDGVLIHRVAPGFVIQGGDPDGNGTGGPGYSIVGEFANNGFEENTISHVRGVISMARSRDYDSAGSQFFITLSDDAVQLDGDYAGFGVVTEGMEVVDEIAAVPTDEYERPLEDIVIESIKIVD